MARISLHFIGAADVGLTGPRTKPGGIGRLSNDVDDPLIAHSNKKY